MSGNFYLDWATIAVSLFNTILLLWLGATVLLNAERRRAGIWFAGGGLLLGGAFFVSHSAILGQKVVGLTPSLRFWGYAGLTPAVLLPFGWYVLMLWYAGFWRSRQTALQRRHRPWLLAAVLLAAAGLAAVIIYANPLSGRFSLLAVRDLIGRLGGISLLASGYAVYLMLCVGLSLDTLLRPGPSSRVMGDQARQRARLWLITASLLLLLISMIVIGALLWILLNLRRDGGYVITDDALETLARFDLLISTLIAIVIIVVGQAVVSYEIFTGKTLPRRGLRRQWGRALLLAAGYGSMVGWALTTQVRPVYVILLATLLMTVFFALLGWRSYAERERYITHLRPFVTSQRLYDRLLSAATPAPPEIDARTPFRALCGDVLGARRAYLVALGPLAPLAGPPLAYPEADDEPPQLLTLDEVTAQFTSPAIAGVPVDPSNYGGASWAIPLWSERGLIGVLLLGTKRDGSLYTQEEMEIARASGERLVDIQASAEMARRLLALQRQQLAESQIVDRRMRRVLHDDVLPRIHAALLALNASAGGSDGQTEETIDLLTGVHRQISGLLRNSPPAVTPAVARLGVLGALQQVVGDELGRAFDEVSWEVTPDAEKQARAVAPLKAEVLFYAAREAIRNAARHGRSSGGDGKLHLQIAARCETEGLALLIEDNGVGMAPSEDGGSGSGQGLALHSTMLAVVGGTLVAESLSGSYTRVQLTIPT